MRWLQKQIIEYVLSVRYWFLRCTNQVKNRLSLEFKDHNTLRANLACMTEFHIF